MARRLLLLALLYLPAGLFAFAIWQGMKVTRSVRQRSVLSLSLAHSVRYIALAMVGMGILLPVCRFLIPLLAWWPQPYYQVVFLLSDGVLLLTGSLLFVTFHAMLHGIRAEMCIRDRAIIISTWYSANYFAALEARRDRRRFLLLAWVVMTILLNFIHLSGAEYRY